VQSVDRVPFEYTIRGVTCADVVGSGGVVVFVDQASEDGLLLNLVGLASILPRADGGSVSGWLPDMSRAVSGLAVA
jgi:hypothetical protein